MAVACWVAAWSRSVEVSATGLVRNEAMMGAPAARSTPLVRRRRWSAFAVLGVGSASRLLVAGIERRRFWAPLIWRLAIPLS